MRRLISSLGYNAISPAGRLGAGDYIQAADRIAANEVSFGQKEMCSSHLADVLNASCLRLPVLPRMGFILPSQEHGGQGTKAEAGYCSSPTRLKEQL